MVKLCDIYCNAETISDKGDDFTKTWKSEKTRQVEAIIDENSNKLMLEISKELLYKLNDV
jgi:hypothetical protein